MLNKTGYIINGVTSSGILFGKQKLKIFDKQYAIDFTNQKSEKLTLSKIKYENFEMHVLRNDFRISSIPTLKKSMSFPLSTCYF